MSSSRECVLKIIKENIKNRELTSLNSFSQLDKLIIQNNLEISFYVTNDLKKVNNKDWFLIDKLNGNSKKYYLVIPQQDLSEELTKLLELYNYKPIEDYCYLQIMHKKITATQNYHDIFNNRCNYVPPNLSIIFKGTNSSITFGRSVNFASDTFIQISHDSNIIIDNIVYLSGNIRLDDNSTLKVCDRCCCKTSDIVICSNSTMIINESTTFTGNGRIYVFQKGNVIIGKDCMLALDVLMLCGDGHPIFDSIDDTRINSFEKTRNIILEDHIWCAMGSTILADTKIKKGTIVAAKAVVKGNFPNNCLIAGNPGIVKRKNIYWTRTEKEDRINKFNNLTEV